MTGRAGALALLLCLVSGSAAAVAEERVRVLLPPEWGVADVETKSGRERVDYLPRNRSAGDWEEKVMVTTQYGMGRSDPRAAANRLIGDWMAACPEAKMLAPTQGKIQGRDLVFLVIGCEGADAAKLPGRDVRRHEVRATMIVRGEENLYTIQRAWHAGESDSDPMTLLREKAQAWQSFFIHDVQYCTDTGQGETCAAGP